MARDMQLKGLARGEFTIAEGGKMFVVSADAPEDRSRPVKIVDGGAVPVNATTDMIADVRAGLQAKSRGRFFGWF